MALASRVQPLLFHTSPREHGLYCVGGRFETMEARFGAAGAQLESSFQKGLRQNLAGSIVMWISVLAALFART